MRRHVAFFALALAPAWGCSSTSEPEVEDPPVEDPTQEYSIDVNVTTRTCAGRTLFADTHESGNPKIVEVDMQGTVTWSYAIPAEMHADATVGPDAELLQNNNVLITMSSRGLYEISRAGGVVWSFADPKVSHDADRLPDGNTIFVFGNEDQKTDAQVREVTPDGQVVWSWYAKDHYDVAPYSGMSHQGWTHTNAVTRLANGNTLINPRNFSLTVEVDSEGEVVWEIDWTDLYATNHQHLHDPHEPELLPNGHLLVCLQWDAPYQVVEVDRSTRTPVWEYHLDGLRTCRDADRLPNGNTLIVGVLDSTSESVILEVAPDKAIVWQLTLENAPVGSGPGWFYKAQRTCQ